MDPELTPDQQATRIKTIRNFVMLYGQPPFLMYAATYQRDSKYSTVRHSTVQYSTVRHRGGFVIVYKCHQIMMDPTPDPINPMANNHRR